MSHPKPAAAAMHARFDTGSYRNRSLFYERPTAVNLIACANDITDMQNDQAQRSMQGCFHRQGPIASKCT